MVRAKYEYEHAFIQHLAGADTADMPISLDVAAGLTAWGADGWEVVNMEAVWSWHREAEGKSWPETLLGYYVTFKREVAEENGTSVATAIAEAEDEMSLPRRKP
ncbi:MAG TPA: hypothetical protein VHB98_01125 [Chloroflexota bacterium]|nr:hypothetical protein [Chloroflexota bacterium]